MAKKPVSRGGRLSAEERVLEKQREEIMRRQQELEHRLKRLPAVMEAQEEQRRVIAKKRAADAAPPISPYVGRNGGARRNRTRSRSLRTPSHQRWAAKLKTISLVFVLIVIVFLLWRVIPTT